MENIKQNKILICLLLVSLIFITGCEYVPDSIKNINIPGLNEQQTIEDNQFQIGKEGLEINFLENKQSTIGEGSLFDINFELQNKGYSDITEGLYRIITEEQYVEIQKPTGVFLLKGKNKYMPQGETKRVTVQAKAGYVDEQITEFPIKTTIISCYSYETIASKAICIDPDINNLNKNKVCELNKLDISEGQGAPIVIKKIIPKMEFVHTGAIPSFEIYLENEGKGQAMAQEYLENACGSKQRASTDNYDLIEVEAILSNEILNCRPDKITVKQGKETKIYCEKTTPLKKLDTYFAPIQIKLKYGYMTSAYGDMKITKRT